jgi:hypothetical protein
MSTGTQYQLCTNDTSSLEAVPTISLSSMDIFCDELSTFGQRMGSLFSDDSDLTPYCSDLDSDSPLNSTRASSSVLDANAKGQQAAQKCCGSCQAPSEVLRPCGRILLCTSCFSVFAGCTGKFDSLRHGSRAVSANAKQAEDRMLQRSASMPMPKRSFAPMRRRKKVKRRRAKRWGYTMEICTPCGGCARLFGPAFLEKVGEISVCVSCLGLFADEKGRRQRLSVKSDPSTPSTPPALTPESSASTQRSSEVVVFNRSVLETKSSSLVVDSRPL